MRPREAAAAYNELNGVDCRLLCSLQKSAEHLHVIDLLLKEA